MNIKLKTILLLFLTLFLVTLLFSKREEPKAIYYKTSANELNCVILLDSRLSSTQGRGVGFSYELLQNYGDNTGKKINIYPSENNVWYRLGQDVDIIVIDSVATEIPKEYKDNIILSTKINKNIVLVSHSDDASLISNFNFWLSDFKKSRIFERMSVRFFRSYKLEAIISRSPHVSYLSPYDELIQEYSSFVGLDWILVAAIMYQESQYYLGARSSKSAQGLMQLKPATAARYGIEDLLNPELNIKAGTLHFEYLYNLYEAEGLDSLNVLKFALASYNAGEGRIAECRTFAKENGYDADNWESVVESFSINPSFWGKQTTKYVSDIIFRYNEYKIALEGIDEDF